MGILRVDHPDIEEFISCKDDLTQVTNFNISVAITDEFMDAVEAGRPYALYNPSNRRPYDAGNGVQMLDARKVFTSIVEHAWRTANRVSCLSTGSIREIRPSGWKKLKPPIRAANSHCRV